MLIRSQNREILINFNVLAGIEIAEGTTKTVVTSYITGCSYLLGEYSTKEKALKVLDMIQEAYAEYEIVKIFETGMGMCNTHHYNMDYVKELEKHMYAKTVFQMPEDSEVEE